MRFVSDHENVHECSWTIAAIRCAVSRWPLSQRCRMALTHSYAHASSLIGGRLFVRESMYLDRLPLCLLDLPESRTSRLIDSCLDGEYRREIDLNPVTIFFSSSRSTMRVSRFS